VTHQPAIITHHVNVSQAGLGKEPLCDGLGREPSPIVADSEGDAEGTVSNLPNPFDPVGDDLFPASGRDRLMLISELLSPHALDE
jgi:hypothetical protein